MTQQVINVGPAPNDGLGDPIRTAYIKCNNNFGELYARAQTTPPASLVGAIGDLAGMYAYDDQYFYYCFQDFDGTSVIWGQIGDTGNIVVSQISNGTSDVAIATEDGNVTISVNGVANVVEVKTVGIFTTGIVSATSNVVGGNVLVAGQVSATGNITGAYFIGNGSQLTGMYTYGNSNVAEYLPDYTGDLYPLSIYTDGYYFANGVPFSGGGSGNYTNANVAAYLPTYSGLLGGTLTTANQSNITSVGTLTSLTINGALTANGISDITLTPISHNVTIAPTFGGVVTINSDGAGSMDNMVIGANHAEAATFTDVSSTGNVTAGYFIGDGSLLTGISGTGSYSNANVAAYLPTYTGNILAGNISVTGNVTVNGTTNANVVGQLTGPVNGINMSYLIWDFGNIDNLTFNTPIAYLFATTAAGNLDMGTINSPSTYNIDIGTIY